jgi:hypothetical protein
VVENLRLLSFAAIQCHAALKDDFSGLMRGDLVDSLAKMKVAVAVLQKLYFSRTGKNLETSKVHTLVSHAGQHDFLRAVELLTERTVIQRHVQSLKRLRFGKRTTPEQCFETLQRVVTSAMQRLTKSLTSSTGGESWRV